MEKERKSGYNRIGSYDPFNQNLNENHDPDRSCPGKGGTYMNTPTPHIAAKQGEIAPSILLPGDPLRAKFIAENFLAGAKQFDYVNPRNREVQIEMEEAGAVHKGRHTLFPLSFGGWRG